MRHLEAGGEFGGLAVAWVVFGSSGAPSGTLPRRGVASGLSGMQSGHTRRYCMAAHAGSFVLQQC